MSILISKVNLLIKRVNNYLIIKVCDVVQIMLLLRRKYFYEANASRTDQIGVKMN
jgi:hypothetical protein